MALRVRPVQSRTEPARISIMPSAQRSPPRRSSARIASAISPASAEWPCWKRVQASRPRAQPQPALVADLLEGGGRLAQQHLGLLGPAGVEGAPRQVLADPGHAPPVVELLVARQRLLEELGGGGVLVAGEGAEAAEAQHLGLARRVAERREHAAGLVERVLRRRPARRLLLDVGEHEQRARRGRGARRRRPAGSPRRRPAASARAGASSRSPARARARPAEEGAVLRAVLPAEQPEPLAVEALGHHRDLGLVGAGGRLLEPVQRLLGEVARQAVDRAELVEELGGAHVVVGDAVDDGVAVGVLVRLHPRRRCRSASGPGRPW